MSLMAYHSPSCFSTPSSSADGGCAFSFTGLEVLVGFAGFRVVPLVALGNFDGSVLRGSWVEGPAMLLEERVVWEEGLWAASSGIGV